jgi:hypothetical protein
LVPVMAGRAAGSMRLAMLASRKKQGKLPARNRMGQS